MSGFVFCLAVGVILYTAAIIIVVGEVRARRRFDAHADAAIDLTGGAR